MADFFLDTFTGTGTLATHVPELGTYVDNDRPLTQFTLDGAGSVFRQNFAGDNGSVALPEEPGTGEVGYEVTCKVIRDQIGETAAFLELESFDTQWYVILWTQGEGVMLLEAGMPDTEMAYTLPEPVTAGQEYTVRAEVNLARTEMKVYLDDVLVLTVPNGTPLPPLFSVWATLGCRGATLPVNSYSLIRAYDELPLPPVEEPIDCCPPLPQREAGDCGDTSCGRAFSETTVSWSDTLKTEGAYTFPEARLYPVETVNLSAPIGRNNEEYRLTIGSALWAPLTIAGLEWTGQYFNNTRRTL